MSFGVVVPTLGTREDMLQRCLRSILRVTDTDSVLISTPRPEQIAVLLERWGLGSIPVRDDDGASLARSIDESVTQLAERHDAVTWVGDDDALLAGARPNVSALVSSGRALVFSPALVHWSDGRRRVVDPGRQAMRFVQAGTNLLRQPACAYRGRSWLDIGGLNTSLSLAFDVDLHLRLHAHGGSVYRRAVGAWESEHGDRLSTSNASSSRQELQQATARYPSLPMVVRRTRELSAWHSPIGRARAFLAKEP